MKINKLLLLFLQIINFSIFTNENFFVFVIPSYNNAQWYEKNLNSVINQTYINYKIIYINDCSSDNTGMLVEKFIKEKNLEHKITLINNKERKGALENIYNAIHSCRTTDIVICLDGDDWLANNNVLALLNNVYSHKTIWLTYGQYIVYPQNYLGGCRDIPVEVFQKNEVRKYDWVTSHLRTFYAGLFHQIKKEDLLYENKFYSMAWDAALMFPMLEMAGPKHIKFISDVLYVYNTQTPLNDNKIDKELQGRLFVQIKSKAPYQPINDFRDKKFVVVIPSYNNANVYKQNLDSVFDQTYQNYRIVYIDDNSPDHTGDLVEKYVQEKKQNQRFTLIKNKKRELAAANIYKAIINCQDEEIVALVDGDDCLAHKNVLLMLNEIYRKNQIWITYGTFQFLSDGNPCHWALPIPKDVIEQNTFREYPHGLTHLRTFYCWLFKQIKIGDLFYEADFYKMTSDVAILLPMIEMASERHKLINSITYIYNDINPINDHRVSMNLQHNLNKQIRSKPKYSRLEDSKENFLHAYDNEKYDVILFSYDPEKLNKILNSIDEEKGINKILILCDFDQDIKDLIKKYPKIIFVNKKTFNEKNCTNLIGSIIKQNSNYIYIATDTYNLEIPDLKPILKSIELTKANAFYFIENNKIIENEIKTKHVEILKSIYAFEFDNYTLSPYIAGIVLRKKDLNHALISNLELEWKYISWKKICLFQVCN